MKREIKYSLKCIYILEDSIEKKVIFLENYNQILSYQISAAQEKEFKHRKRKEGRNGGVKGWETAFKGTNLQLADK